ncbi:hypothetical protein [Catellatospora tritici]|uniref:hypothetical protein n=1 Tax=Catellatospora tritici TaxID=2851566 RepID=UPI001C2DB244|nr:hypothetical protein [Catellatospora tritici]MBV1853739.1 hypothetical protein [Catellatospora tritici]
MDGATPPPGDAPATAGGGLIEEVAGLRSKGRQLVEELVRLSRQLTELHRAVRADQTSGRQRPPERPPPRLSAGGQPDSRGREPGGRSGRDTRLL